jgi:hypothetical protein
VTSWQAAAIEIRIGAAMKTSLVSLCALCLAFPLAGHSQVYKCTTDASLVIYRDTPCNTNEVSITLAQAPVKATLPDGPTPTIEPRSPTRPLKIAMLALGMSDTEILNKRGWGRPGKITRSKVNRSFNEEWTYTSAADGQTVLQFSNGMLAAINHHPVETAAYAPQQMVQFDSGRALQ